MILLDTNVVSEAMTRDSHPRVRAWLDAQAAETLFLSSITVAELLFGIGTLPAGKRRDALAAALDEVLGVFAARVLPFDTSAARRYGDLAVRAISDARRLYRRDRRRARFRRGVPRPERVQGRRPARDRPLDGGALRGGPTGLPHPEERCEAARLEGWATAEMRVPTLRDAALRAAPQGEVYGGTTGAARHSHSIVPGGLLVMS
jgi:predicted nucleic acid-binding protein